MGLSFCIYQVTIRILFCLSVSEALLRIRFSWDWDLNLRFSDRATVKMEQRQHQEATTSVQQTQYAIYTIVGPGSCQIIIGQNLRVKKETGSTQVSNATIECLTNQNICFFLRDSTSRQCGNARKESLQRSRGTMRFRYFRYLDTLKILFTFQFHPQISSSRTVPVDWEKYEVDIIHSLTIKDCNSIVVISPRALLANGGETCMQNDCGCSERRWID